MSCSKCPGPTVAATKLLIAYHVTMYQSDMEDDVHPTYDFVNTDSQLDSKDEDLPWNHFVEICAMTTHCHGLHEATQERDVLANQLPLHVPLNTCILTSLVFGYST